MNQARMAIAGATMLFLAACASSGSDRRADTLRGVETRSMDGSFTGEVIGQAAPDSGFARLRIGMTQNEVQEIMDRAPDRQHSYESGKRWIPFYYGNDARRMQVLYRDEGCLIFTDGNIWGGAGGDLVQIEVDPSGACYEP
jgi:hypothetical protein